MSEDKTQKDLPVFRIKDGADRTVVRVRAKSAAAALNYAKRGLSAEKLSTKDIIETVQRGLAIDDAESGLVIDANDETGSPPDVGVNAFGGVSAGGTLSEDEE